MGYDEEVGGARGGGSNRGAPSRAQSAAYPAIERGPVSLSSEKIPLAFPAKNGFNSSRMASKQNYA